MNDARSKTTETSGMKALLPVAEFIRDALDASVRAWMTEGKGGGRISGKTAMNVWSALTSAFKAATSSKRRDLRVLEGKPNPCVGVELPGDRESRKARRKLFVYPKECAAVLAFEEIPLAWREAHAHAAYTYLRPGELRVLTWLAEDLGGELGAPFAPLPASLIDPSGALRTARRVRVNRL